MSKMEDKIFLPLSHFILNCFPEQGLIPKQICQQWNYRVFLYFIFFGPSECQNTTEDCNTSLLELLGLYTEEGWGVTEINKPYVFVQCHMLYFKVSWFHCSVNCKTVLLFLLTEMPHFMKENYERTHRIKKSVFFVFLCWVFPRWYLAELKVYYDWVL